MPLARPSFEIEVPFDELSLSGYRSTSPERDWQFAIHAAGKVTVRVTSEDWCISEIAIDRHARDGRGLWEQGQSVLALDHPLYPFVKAAIETRLADEIEASIREAMNADDEVLRLARAA